MRSPFAELSDAEYDWFVDLWGDATLADQQLTSPYGILGGCSAIELLRRSSHGWRALPFVYARCRRQTLRQIEEAHSMNRAGVYA